MKFFALSHTGELLGKSNMGIKESKYSVLGKGFNISKMELLEDLITISRIAP